MASVPEALWDNRAIIWKLTGQKLGAFLGVLASAALASASSLR